MVKLIKTKVEWVFHMAGCKPSMDSNLELVWSRLPSFMIHNTIDFFFQISHFIDFFLIMFFNFLFDLTRTWHLKYDLFYGF